MSKTPVLAAVSAALLALAIPAYGTDGVAQRIKDEQYSGFVSGASFCAGTYDGSAVWTNANETWSASKGLDRRYWSGTEGATVASASGEAPDGSDYYHSYEAWQRAHQPPVYGHVAEDAGYSSLYRRAAGNKTSLVDIDTATAAPVVCRFAEEGDVAAADGSDIFFDANVTLEAFAYGEANRPDDSVLAPDAKLAIYMQDTTPTGDPGFFIVARDWNTGAAQHYRVQGVYYLVLLMYIPNKHNGPVPAFLVYLTDGQNPLSYDPDPDASGHRPDAERIQWDDVRDDFGDWHRDCIPFFQPLTAAYDMRLSRVSYGGGIRLGAYAVGTADPMRTTARWEADSSMVRLLKVDGTDIDGLSGPEYTYQGADAVDAGVYAYYRDLYYGSGYVHGSVSWRGVNGWSDGSYDMTPGGGCEIMLGTDCLPKGRASLDSVNEFDPEDFDEFEREYLPARTGERIGDRYVEVPDALAHAAVLGGTVKLLAYPMAPLVMPPLKADVTISMNEHTVPAEHTYACALGLADYLGDWSDWVARNGLSGDVVAYAAPGHRCTFTLNGGSIGPDEATVYSNYIYGGLSVTGVSLRVTGVQIEGFSQICDSPDAVVSGGFESGLYATNTALSVTGGYVSYDEYGSTAPAFMSNTALRVEGGSLSVSGGAHGRVACYSVNPVSITGGSLSGLALYDSSVTTLGATIGGAVSISNNPAIAISAEIDGPLTLEGIHGDVTFSGSMYSSELRVSGAEAVTITSKASYIGGFTIRNAASFTLEAITGYVRGDILIQDTPVVALSGGYMYNTGNQGVLKVYNAESVLFDGMDVGHHNSFNDNGSRTVVISNSASTVVTRGLMCATSYGGDPTAGRFSVYDGELTVRGGTFWSFDAHSVSSAVISNAPAFHGGVSIQAAGSMSISGSPKVLGGVSLSAPDISISGGTFGSDRPFPHNGWWPPDMTITSTNALITGGTFNATIRGSGIVVSGGRFLWYSQQSLGSSGVLVPAEGKKLVHVGGNSKSAYWEVHNK